MRIDLSGQHALVTGGTSGIGAAIARALAAAGAAVSVSGLSSAEVAAFRADDRHSGMPAHILDVANDDAVRQLVGGFERLDIAVNCAGMIRRAEEHHLENFLKVVDVNLAGTMRVAIACRPLLAKQGGCIVNIASMLSFFGAGMAPAYSASKGGVAQLTKSLAIAYANEGIRVNAIAPGWIATQLTGVLRQDAERNRQILERTPLKRWGTPEDIAGAVVFLCSPAAGFITGAIVPVDGGYLVA